MIVFGGILRRLLDKVCDLIYKKYSHYYEFYGTYQGLPKISWNLIKVGEQFKIFGCEDILTKQSDRYASGILMYPDGIGGDTVEKYLLVTPTDRFDIIKAQLL